MKTNSLIVIVTLGLLAAGCSKGHSRPPAAGGADTAATTSDVAAVTTIGAAMTLDEILAADVIFEDLTPGVGFDEPLPPDAPPLSAALFTRGPGGLTLEVVIERPESWLERTSVLSEPDTTWRLDDPVTGVTFAEGTFELPHICDCGETKDHASGCSRRSHSAAFRLDLPRLAAKERLVIADLTGAVLGTWDLEAAR